MKIICSQVWQVKITEQVRILWVNMRSVLVDNSLVVFKLDVADMLPTAIGNDLRHQGSPLVFFEGSQENMKKSTLIFNHRPERYSQ